MKFEPNPHALLRISDFQLNNTAITAPVGGRIDWSVVIPSRIFAPNAGELRKQGREEEARRSYGVAAQIFLKHLGPAHETTR